MLESTDDGETEVDKVTETLIKRTKFYNISFQIGV